MRNLIFLHFEKLFVIFSFSFSFLSFFGSKIRSPAEFDVLSMFLSFCLTLFNTLQDVYLFDSLDLQHHPFMETKGIPLCFLHFRLDLVMEDAASMIRINICKKTKGRRTQKRSSRNCRFICLRLLSFLFSLQDIFAWTSLCWLRISLPYLSLFCLPGICSHVLHNKEEQRRGKTKRDENYTDDGCGKRRRRRVPLKEWKTLFQTRCSW